MKIMEDMETEAACSMTDNVIKSESQEEKMRKFTLLYAQMINEAEQRNYALMRLQANHKNL